MEKALNAQINAEFWSAYLYLSMSVHFSAKGMKGVANWFAVQFKEEQDHAQIFVDYVLARGGRVTLAPIADDPQARMEQPPGIPVVEAVYIGKKNLHVGNALSIIIRRTESAAAPRIEKKRIVRKDDPPKFPFRPDDYAPAIEGAVYTRAASSLSIM